MKAILLWRDQLKDNSNNQLPVYDVAFHPNGDRLVVGAGNFVQVYNIEEGKVIHKTAAHKDIVHSVAYSRDGKLFASGSADKHVILWSDKFEGRLKYIHNEGVQCLSFSPVAQQLLSCSSSEINLWSTEQNSLVKRKVSSRVCSCNWTSDGQFFALGLFNGSVTIWTKNGDEKVKIEIPGANPVFALAWNPSRNDQYDILTVCDWGQKLSLYQLNGRQIGKERDIGFDACCFVHAHDSDFVIIGGSNKMLSVYSKDGLKLSDIGDEHDSWVWACAYHSKGQYVVLSCADGVLECHQILPSTVHGLYKDRYAFREGLTEVTIQHLVTDERVNVKCRDLVKKIAVYKNKLAVQLPERIAVYELSACEESGDIGYVLKHKFPHFGQCSLLVMCNDEVVACMDKTLLCFSTTGKVKRKWEVDSQVRYIKAVGGPTDKQVLLVGLKNGKILKVFLDNPFHVEIMKINGVIRCLDLSMSRSKLAVVDDTNVLTVYDMKKKKVIYQEPNANSVAWNTQYEDMLCYTGNGFLCIKASTYPAHQQRQQSGQGFVVGFTGSRIFSLHYFKMSAVDIPQTTSMIQYLERKMYKEAYMVACLGVTPADWRTLALESLEGMNLKIAKKAFIRLKDYPFLELIYSIEERVKQGESNNKMFLAEVLANQKKFQEAAKIYKAAECLTKVVEMYTDLCEFELAKQYMKITPVRTQSKSKDVRNDSDKAAIKKLITKQADWASTINDSKTAVEMYLSAGEYAKAILIMFDNKQSQQLIDLSMQIDVSKKEALKLCGQKLKLLGEFGYAAEVYEKLHDSVSLANLYAQTQQWQKGFDLVQLEPDIKDLIYLPYATQLVEEDRFEEAQEAMRKADRENEAVHLLVKLTKAALSQNKFKDASYYHWLQAKANLAVAQKALKDTGDCDLLSFVNEFHCHIQRAEIYYAYYEVHKFIYQPFTKLQPDALFNMARFVLYADIPPYVSKVCTLLTLAKQATAVGGYKAARYAYDQLQSCLIPTQLQDFVDSGMLNIRGKPLQDNEELLPFCYRCSTRNPLISTCTSGSCCITCGEPFVHSFISFEVLPVVQFHLEEDISDSEAVKLIQSEPPQKKQLDSEPKTKDVDVLTFNEDNEDPFNEHLLATEKSGVYSYPTLTVDRNMLVYMHWKEVVVKKWPPPLRYQYYRSILPNVQIRLCPSCNQMFYAEDYELHVACKGACPFCRLPLASKTTEK